MAAASHWSAQAGTGLSLVGYDSLPGISCFRRVRLDLNVGFMGVGCLVGGCREGQLGMKLKLGDMQFWVKILSPVRQTRDNVVV